MTNAPDLMRAVARIHGLRDGPISEPPWPGVVNEVNIVGGGTDRYAIRIPRDRVQNEEFAVEALCAERAREHAVPTADVVAGGMVNAVAYSVQRCRRCQRRDRPQCRALADPRQVRPHDQDNSARGRARHTVLPFRP
jgi:hypothetical protein